MSNAKNEFVEEIRGKSTLCASLERDDNTYCLQIGHSKAEFDEFLESLDFEYDSGYGGQKLYGTIWYDDGTWSERGEYDGSEWWEYKQCPDIPKRCTTFKV